MPHTIKSGDTPTLRWSLGRAIAGATCLVLIRDRADGELVVSRNATVINATTGEVSLTLTGDEVPVGSYRVEIQTTSSGVILTHPNDGYEALTVLADLNPPT